MFYNYEKSKSLEKLKKNYIKQIIILGLMFIFLLMQIKMKISSSQLCCNIYDNTTNIVTNADQDYVWNFEFTLNEFPLQIHTNLMKIKQHSQFEITIMILRSENGFQYTLSENENNQFQYLELVQLGVFQQIFIQTNMYNLEFEWYSDFKITLNHTFSMLEPYLPQIIFNQEILCYQQIRNIYKHVFIRDCESLFHIKIQLYPQLKYIRSQQFNNNYYSLSFWVKQIQSHSNMINLLIEQEDKQDESLRMGIINNYVNLLQYDNLIYVDQYDQKGWVFFQLTYQLNQRKLEYQRQEQLQNLSFYQSFSQYLRVFIIPDKNVIFTAVQLHLTRQNNVILCVPGCLNCDQQGYCLQCEEDYFQNGNFCECKQNFQFIFLPSECYIKLEYQILSKSEKNINCPQFGGQQCPQCEDDRNQNFRYCLYLTNIQLQFKQLELEDNYYHLFISYNVEDNSYLPENTDNQNQQEFFSTNIIYLSEKLYDFYYIGDTVDNQKKCYNGYYYHIRCRQIMKQCRIQEHMNNCNICNKNYVLLNGKCSKCPYKCQHCQMNQKTQICLKCQQGHFLNFQRKCIRCNIENCEQCYHYNGQLNTLERNFQIQKLGFTYQLGCSYCQDKYSLILDKRVCSQIYDEQNLIQVEEKFYFFDQLLLQLLQTLHRTCGIQINQCSICQNDICLLCNQNYILNVQNNLCIQKQYNFTIYNQNLMIQDYDSQYNLVTFLFFDYNYTDIIIQQKQFYLKDCQFNNYGKVQRIDSIQCFSELNYVQNYKQCPFYCNSCLNNLTCLDYKYIIKFYITFTVLSQYNNTYLNNSNNFVSNLNSVHQLENNYNQFTILINQIRSSVFYIFQDVFKTEHPYTLLIQFNYTMFLHDDYLTFDQPVIIENSILNIYGILAVIHNRSNEQAIFKSANSSFIGQTNQSILVFQITKPWKIIIENLIISNLSSLTFIAIAKTIYIFNLTLINLNLSGEVQEQFILRSNQLIIEQLQIINCTIFNTVLFQIYALNINIHNLRIVSTISKNSIFMLINAKEQNTIIQIYNIFIFQIEYYESTIFSNNNKCFTINLFDLLVEQAKSIDSYFILLQKFDTVLLKNLSFIDSQLINTMLIYVESNTIFQKSIIIQRNIISNSNDRICSLNYQGETIHIIELQYQQIQLKGHYILFLESNIMFINDMQLFNVTIENFDANPLIVFDSQEIKIKNMKLFDLKTQAILILFQAKSLHLDNFIVRDIQIIDPQKQKHIIQFRASLKLIIQVIYIDNIVMTINKEDSYQLQHRLFLISASNVTLFNSLIQNLYIPNLIIFSIINSAYMNMTKLQATNVSAFKLLDTKSDFNIITQLNFDQVEFTQYIFNYEPSNTFSCLFLANLNIIRNYFDSFLCIIQKFYRAQINQRQKYTIYNFINIQMPFSRTSIKNILILQSQLEGILVNKCEHQLFTLSNIKIKKVNFKDSYIFSTQVVNSAVYLSKIQMEYCQNVAFYIQAIVFRIENLIFADSQIAFIVFHQNQDKQTENHQSIFRNIYLVNNTQIIHPADSNLIFFNFTQKQHFIQGLTMFNNTSKQKGHLAGFIGQFILQILLIDNHCESQCLYIYTHSIILLRYYSDQIKNLEKNQYLLDGKSKLIDYQNYIQSEYFQMKIQINSKIQINDMKLLYIPSGQKLTKYKVYDFIYFKLDDYIQSIQLVHYQDHKTDLIQGIFIINSYEYDQIQQKIIRNLSEYQNFLKFEQSGQQSELNNFKIIYNPYEQNILMIQIYKADDPSIQLKIYAKTQLCQMGEIFVKNQCLVCNPELQIYSTKQKSNFCSIVDYSMVSKHKQGSIKLNVGYWRPFVYSSTIEKCESIQNCQGGWHTGDNSCNIGYIGGNCNACDLFNVRGNGYYQLESQQCKLCGEFKYVYFVFKVLLIIMIYFVKLFFQMNSNIQNYRKLLLQRLVNSRYYFILAKFISDRSSLVLNMLIRNFALLSIIISDIFDLPEILTIFTNPIILERNSSTCLNTFVNSNHQNWIIASKIIIAILTFNIFITIIVLTNQKQMKNYFLFPLISLFLFQGPTITVLSIQQTMYLTYSNVRYTYFDYALRYFSYDHQRNLTHFTLPLLILFFIILPFIIFLIMRRQQRYLFKGRTFIQLGNFILPYRYYYQELINYFRNIMLLQLLLFNLKMLTKINKLLILILIIYIYNQIYIYKIKLISHYETQQGIILIAILYLSYIVTPFEDAQKLPIIIITLFLLILSFNQYIYYLFKDNKLQIYELLQNRRKIIHYLNMKNYDQCLNNWKNIKLNHQYLVLQKKKFRQQQQRNIQHIILQTQNTQEINNSVRQSIQEIEMREL